MLLFCEGKAAQRRADPDADLFTHAVSVKSGVVERELRCDERKLRESLGPRDRASVQKSRRIEIVRLSGDVRTEVAGIEARQRVHPDIPAQRVPPKRLHADADRRHDPDARYDDAMKQRSVQCAASASSFMRANVFCAT